MSQSSTQYVPDFTGANPDYVRINDPYTLGTANARIELPTFFADSLTITAIDGSGTVLVKGTDYDIEQQDYDYTAMARAQNARSTFSAILANHVTILRPQAQLPIKVVMGYQQFYLPAGVVPMSAGVGSVNITPEWFADISRRMSAFEQIVAKVQNPGAGTTATPRFLQFDINGTTDANVIKGEIQTVNTYNGVRVIRPVQGSFFKDSVSIVDGSGNTLVADTDYVIFSFNAKKTQETLNTSGIYDLILISTDYQGDVGLTYRAVGGDVTVYDIAAVYTAVQGIETYLNNTQYVSSDALPDEPVIRQMLATINKLQDNMRILLTNGSPKYGAATSGTTVSKQIAAKNTGLHWYNIATLYQVPGATDIVTADRFSCHIQLVKANLIADVDVAVNMGSARNPVSISARNVVMDTGFTLFGDADSTQTKFAPRFRVVWDQVTGVAGITLQMGVYLPSLNDVLVVEDNSGLESCWMLDSTGGNSQVIDPNDTGFLLPDGKTVWAGSGTSASYSRMITGDVGVPLFVGQMDFSAVTNPSAGFSITNSYGQYVDFKSIKKIKAYFSAPGGNVHSVDLDVFPATTSVAGTYRAEGIIPTSDVGDTSLFRMTIDPTSDASNAFTAYITGVAATGYSLRYLIGLDH